MGLFSTKSTATHPSLNRRQVIYSGNVQGVGFRYRTCALAREFEVGGFVRNLSDGRVELIAEGSVTELDHFLEALAERMSGKIDDAHSDTLPAEGDFARFEIRY